VSPLPSEAKSSLKGSVYFAIRDKKQWQNSLSRAFAVDGKIDTISLKCECSCLICPIVEKCCPNNGQFSSVGYATAFPASPRRTLMLT